MPPSAVEAEISGCSASLSDGSKVGLGVTPGVKGSSGIGGSETGAPLVSVDSVTGTGVTGVAVLAFDDWFALLVVVVESASLLVV